MKTCSKCSETKPTEAFSRSARAGDGRESKCRDCRRAYREANRDRIKARDREYREANRDRRREYDRLYRLENQGKMPTRREYWAKYRESNRDKLRPYFRAYMVKNPHYHWEAQYRLRAKKYGFDPVMMSFSKADVIAAYGDACSHCGGPFEHLDHYPVPVVKGGPHTLENVRPSCASCNARTGVRRDAG